MTHVRCKCSHSTIDEFTITAAQFNKWISPIMKRIERCLVDLGKQVVKKYAGKKIGRVRIVKEDSPEEALRLIVDSVILVGGSSKLLSVQAMLREFFGDVIYKDEDTQLCVSKGVMEAVCMIDDPLKSVREVLYHTLVVKEGEKEIGRVSRGVTIPFDTHFGIRPSRRCSQVHVSICEIDEEKEENNETQLVEGTFACPKARQNLIPYVSLKIRVDIDGMICVSARDEMNGDEFHIGTVDLWSV